MRRTATYYRRSLWADADVRVEIWCEKDAIAGVIVDVIDALAQRYGLGVVRQADDLATAPVRQVPPNLDFLDDIDEEDA